MDSNQSQDQAASDPFQQSKEQNEALRPFEVVEEYPPQGPWNSIAYRPKRLPLGLLLHPQKF
jgi:hypothetical protein